jgi:hypothetical protein
MTNLAAQMLQLCDRLVTIGHEQKVTYQEAAHDPAATAPHWAGRDSDLMGKLAFACRQPQRYSRNRHK